MSSSLFLKQDPPFNKQNKTLFKQWIVKLTFLLFIVGQNIINMCYLEGIIPRGEQPKQEPYSY